MPQNRRDTVGHTFKVALSLCVVCSVLVSAAAVAWRGPQQENRVRFMRTNIMIAAGLWEPGADLDALFEHVDTRIVELETGEFTTAVDPATYDQRRATRDPELSKPVPRAEDIAGIRRREHYSAVYLVRDAEGNLDQIVLPVRGYGLWSTLWGFLSLDVATLLESPDDLEIRGLTYYEHAETPGLGGEVDNPNWRDQWREDKRVYDDEWNVQIRVIKGVAPPDAPYQVDGLAGATITANGVTNMLHYWLGENGFGPFLRNVHQRPEMLETEGEDHG